MQDWMIVQYPGLNYEGSWIQKEDCIINTTPTDARPEDMCEGGKYSTNTFVGMMLRTSFNSLKRITSTMSFDYKMAPLIFIANEIDTVAKIPVLQERYEVVLYYKGINVWEHFQHDGKIKYNRKLFCSKNLSAKQKHWLEVAVNPNEKSMTVTLGDICFTAHTPLLGDSYYIGIIGCEGVNRFYDFEVTDL